MFNVCVEMETIEKKEIELDEESEVYLKCPFDDDFMVQILPKRNNFPPRPAGELFFDVLDIQKHLRTIPDSTLKDLIQNAKNEKVDTYYEREMRAWMLNKLLFQQQHSIDQINMLIDQINEDIRNLYLQLNYKVYTLNRLRLHIMALNQELAVLKRFERNEFILEKQVQENNTAVLDMTDAITDLMNKISDINRLIDDCNVKMEAIFQSFTQATNNNKFYDFLRKVFKKKFKVPRIREEDDSSSDSSSSSSDESDDDDAASLDSRDFGFIKLDLNVCPKGCEQAIYDYTVQLRQKRYEIEASVKENEKQIETYRKELEMHNKKLGVLEGNYQKSKQSLWEYQREKQRVLNDIIYTLVVKMDQFQYIENFNVENCVVMSKNTLSRLYSRVSELQQEGLHEKEKHEIYIRHLMRMKRDFHFMDQQIRKLKQEISYQMFIKFGRMVDIDDVELYVIKSTLKSDLTDMAEVCIKKMVYDLRRKNVGEATKSFKKEIKRLITFKAKKQFDYINLLKTNTAKAELLRILNKKRGLLEADLNSQDVKMMSFEYYDEQIKQDKVELEKMQGIIESQENEIQDLKDEIQMLKTKGYPPRPVRERRKMEEVEEPIDFAEYFKTFVDAGEEDEERISADIILPYIYTDAEAIVRSLIEDLMIQTEELAEKRSTEKMAREIVERVLKCTSCHAIVRELIDNLPITPSDEQLKMIDETASRLLQIQDLDEDDGEIKFQLETEEEKQAYFLELVEQIIDEVMLIHGEPYEVMTRLLMRVVEEVPVLYLIRKECIDKLANQFGSKISLEGLRNEILPEIECISDFHKEDLRTVASAVILRMQGSADVVARELVEDLVDTILLERGKTFNVMAHIIERLVASIPVQVLMQEESFDNIADVIKDKFDRKLDYEPLLEGISSVELSRIMDVRAILNIILHRVYGEGLDYLYVVNNARQYRVQGYNIDVEPE
ncbi:unnamed protein product [Brassicogethes aeneus]|uniref:Uncharacterized protein n=1 Tax=Brassicogethes aeneus TaxID=1431903 RepID=A0A9P0BE41_BRAAE|nr:unnamed protein product [Brassicogethes aeneus]